MRIADKTYRRFSFEQYLNLLEDTGFRFEFNDGLVIPVNYGRPIDSLDLDYLEVVMAKSTASKAHNWIISNVMKILYASLDTDKYRLYSEGRSVYMVVEKKYAYPDIVIAEDEQERFHAETDALVNPVVLIEVLSDSTQENDKTWKWAAYQHMESLREYLMIAQHEPKVERYARLDSPDEWKYKVYEGLGSQVGMESVNVNLPLAKVYKKVDFSSGK